MHRITHEHEGLRVDVFVSSVAGVTRNAAQNLIGGGHVTVGGIRPKPSYRLKADDLLVYNIPAPQVLDIKAENIALDIVYEDGDIIVVNKPKGMVVHPAPGHYTKTLVSALLHHCEGSLSGINGVMRPGIVHRIDKDTSGLLVCAKNDAAHQALALQFAAHSIERAYFAITIGGFKEERGTINAPLARSKKDRKKMAVDPKGKPAITHYSLIERLASYSLIEARLETGRTHQVRAHMAHIKRPLLGDAVYGPAKQPLNLDGQTLHAYKLGFIHPNGREMAFTSDPPSYFVSLLKRLRLP